MSNELIERRVYELQQGEWIRVDSTATVSGWQRLAGIALGAIAIAMLGATAIATVALTAVLLPVGVALAWVVSRRRR